MDDIEAIKQLKARYFRTMDTKDWDGFADVFAPNLGRLAGSERRCVEDGRGARAARRRGHAA